MGNFLQLDGTKGVTIKQHKKMAKNINRNVDIFIYGVKAFTPIVTNPVYKVLVNSHDKEEDFHTNLPIYRDYDGLNISDNNLVSVNGAVTTININDPKYDNKVVYINLDDPKFASLLSNWASEPNGHHLDINKRSSTVIVFTTQKTTPITLGKVSVYAPDSPWYSSAPSDGVHDYDYYSSVTTHSGNQSTHNTYVDMEIAQKLIWNITKSNEIQIESSAGTFLCLAVFKMVKHVLQSKSLQNSCNCF